MDNFNLKKFLGEKSLLNENAPGYDTRKFGEALPTLESVKAAHEGKINEDIEDEIASRIRKLGKENGIANANIEKYIDELSGFFEPDAYKNTTDAELLDDLKLYVGLAEGVIKEERFDGEREMMMHIKQYRDGMIDGDDLVQAFEEIINGKVTPPGYNTRYGR